MKYWDTSALLKLYVQEPDSVTFLNALLHFGQAPVTAELSRIELYSAFRKKEHIGDLAPGGARRLYEQFLGDCAKGRVAVAPSGADVTKKSVELVDAGYGCSPPIMVRSLDVIHVASALLTGCNMVVGTDLRQRELAALAGLALFPT